MQHKYRIGRSTVILYILALCALYLLIYSKWFYPLTGPDDEPASSMAAEDVVTVDWLDKNKDHVVILDATYEMKGKPDYKEFREKYYGQFEDLMNVKTGFGETYAKEHIPEAIHFNIDVAFYPSEYIRFDLYPPEEFEKYVRLLGINAGDHIVIYSRGAYGGMIWAARAWWTFKVYGHDKVSVLNGGFDAWKKAGKEVSSDVVQRKLGSWSAKPIDHSQVITFEELDEKRPGRKSLFEDLSKINYLDARPAMQFTGGPGSHLRGAKNVPLDEVATNDGLKSKQVIQQALEEAGYDDSLPIVTGCNGGVQASLLTLAVRYAGKQARLFNGSLYEVSARAPELISGK
ncbi:unnamed protein product [Cylicocyclus nassatus]|uniref:thiosulfate sulfurtransferase n=1 Tax=Cylicocyclus nassatus TaxID=53992 RepID=A0AA36H0V1_CYLNA|nr:unnamed protein product [Cylicocyclus nassatus]